jgi:hypothetical protein
MKREKTYRILFWGSLVLAGVSIILDLLHLQLATAIVDIPVLLSYIGVAVLVPSDEDKWYRYTCYILPVTWLALTILDWHQYSIGL